MEKKVENRRIKLTKKMLKDALVELLENKDIYHISIRELCDLADVNRTTFYKYYGSQFDLLTDMENDLLVMVKESIIQNISKKEKVVEAVCEYLEDNIKLARLFVNNNVDPTFPSKIFSLTSLQEAVGGLFKSTNEELDREYLFNFLMYGSYRMLSVWLNKDKRETPTEFAKILIETITETI